MKKLLIWLSCLVLVFSVAACGDDTPEVTAPTGDTTSSTETDATTSTEADATNPGSGSDTGTQKPTSTGKSEVAQPSDNIVDWGAYFGDDETTTTKTGQGTDTQKTQTTTTTTKTETTTTLKPTVIEEVSLPAVGTDVDGKGRIKISAVSLEKGVMSITIHNGTDQQKTQWITEETDYVAYTCYDKNGKELKGSDEMFGYLYIGVLEEGDDISFNVTLPAGTAKVAITGSKIVYWTPWTK